MSLEKVQCGRRDGWWQWWYFLWSIFLRCPCLYVYGGKGGEKKEKGIITPTDNATTNFAQTKVPNWLLYVDLGTGEAGRGGNGTGRIHTDMEIVIRIVYKKNWTSQEIQCLRVHKCNNGEQDRIEKEKESNWCDVKMDI